MKLSKINFPLILISLIPVSFVIGPLILELFINILNILFLIEIFKKKKFSILKNNFFLYFIIFYVFLILGLLNSNFFSQNVLNILSYIRFIILPFSIFYFLNINKHSLKFCYIILSITMLIIVSDGIFQFFFDKNLIGFQKYRPDRISGFFKEDLILGSYVTRLFPLLIGLTLFFKNKIKYSFINIFLIFMSLFLIFISGERASFLMTLIAITMIFFYVDISKFLKSLFVVVCISATCLILIFNPIVFDRHIKQLKNHIISNDKDKSILPYYMPMFETTLNMYKFNRLTGTGPKSYRYVCNEEKYVSYFPNRFDKIDNTRVKISISWKELRNLEPQNFFVNKGDKISKGDKIFTYNFIGDDKIYTFFSDKEGIITKIYKKKRYVGNDDILNIDPQYSEKFEYVKKNACSTHPHNFYFQLLGETGLIGFFYILFLFLFLFFKILKVFFYKYFKNKKIMSDAEFCIFVGFFITLWPLTTNGNFFNNWINLISFYPVGFFLYLNSTKLKNTE